MHGYGVYKWKDGRRYEGEYYMDKKHGQGKYQWADGRVYIGPWVNGKQQGQGEYVLPDGTRKIGVWVEGKRVNWIDNADGQPVADSGAKDNNDENGSPSEE